MASFHCNAGYVKRTVFQSYVLSGSEVHQCFYLCVSVNFWNIALGPTIAAGSSRCLSNGVTLKTTPLPSSQSVNLLPLLGQTRDNVVPTPICSTAMCKEDKSQFFVFFQVSMIIIRFENRMTKAI